MREPEIQPPAPLIRRRVQILQLLLRRQGIPLFLPLLIPPRIIHLTEPIQEDIQNADTDEHAVSATI